MTTPEARIRAAMADAARKADAADFDSFGQLAAGMRAGLCALLAELRAPREGEVVPDDWYQRQSWVTDSGYYVSRQSDGRYNVAMRNSAHGSEFDTLAEAIAAVAAASKARGG